MKGYRARTGPVWIYYVQSGDNGPIKIGIANDPWQRIEQMQTGNPEKLRLLALQSARVQREAELHAEFADDRLRGEWFTPSKRLLGHIAQLWMFLPDAILTFPHRFDATIAAEFRAAADEILEGAA